MNYYKEIFVDFESNCNLEPQVYNLFSNENNVDNRPIRNGGVKAQNNKKGFTFSFDFYIIQCITEGDSISVTITKTINSNFLEKESPLNFISKYRFNLNEQIINNEVFIYASTQDSFIIAIFLNNFEVKQIEFKTSAFSEAQTKNYLEHSKTSGFASIPKFLVYQGAIPSEKLSKITSIDHVIFDAKDNSDYFTLGLATGAIAFIHISKKLNNYIQISIIKELRHDNVSIASSLQESESTGNPLTDGLNFAKSVFNINFKDKLTGIFSSKVAATPVKAVKYLKDNLVCCITEDKKFKIYNQNLNKEVYSNDRLLENLNLPGNLINSKIAYFDYDSTRRFFLETRSKILFFCIYFEFANQYYLNIFELQFFNIPLSNELVVSNVNTNGTASSYGNFKFALGDYGNNIRFNKNKIVKLNGRLIDLVSVKDKFWSVSRKGNEAELTDKQFNKYDIKIFNTFKVKTEISENTDNVNDENSETANISGMFNLNIGNSSDNAAEQNQKNNIQPGASSCHNDPAPFFSYVNQEIILLDSKLKNFSYIIKQISLIKNEKIKNTKLFKLLCSCERIISNEHLMNYNKRLIFDDLNKANNININNYSSYDNVSYLRDIEAQKDLINRRAILKRIFSDKLFFSADGLIAFVLNLIAESLSNEIISFGYIKNNNIDSVCFNRTAGIGFLRYIWEFQKLNEIIHFHESNIRGMIFQDKKQKNGNIENIFNEEYSVVPKTEKEMKILHNKIMNYMMEQNRILGKNSLFIILALLRIILTEKYINLNDYNHIVEYFNNENDVNKTLENLIKDHLGEYQQRENSLLFIESLNSVIAIIYKNNFEKILFDLNEILETYKNYSNQDFTTKTQQVESKLNKNRLDDKNLDFKFNFKFCEIIKKLTQDKIESLFFLGRDMLSLVRWIETYFGKRIPQESSFRKRLKIDNQKIIHDEEADNNQPLNNENEIKNNAMDIEDTKQKRYSLEKENKILSLRKIGLRKNFTQIEYEALLKIFNNKCTKIFSQSYSVYLLSYLSNSLMIPEKSAFKKLCIFIEEKENDNNFNYLDLKIYEIFNAFGTKIFKFFDEDIVDFIIINIWSGLFFHDFKYQNDQNGEEQEFLKTLILETIKSLISFKEMGLVNLLLKLYYSQENSDSLTLYGIDKRQGSDRNLESTFIRIISYAKLESRRKFIQELNFYLEYLHNIMDENFEQEKKKFRQFYKIYTGCEVQKEDDSKKKNDKLSFQLEAFYLLEEYLNKSFLLQSCLRKDFYYNAFNFIFPLIKVDSSVIGMSPDYFSNQNKKFIIDFLYSCMQIDFDLGLSFYLTIINDVYEISDLNAKLVDIFIEYIFEFLKKQKFSNINTIMNIENNMQIMNDLTPKNEENFSNNVLIKKLILSDSRLINAICDVLEDECLEIKTHNKLNFYFTIKENLLQESISNNRLDIKMSLNVFYLLHKIYTDMQDNYNSARISFLYLEAIDELIKTHSLTIDEMLKMYLERAITVQNLLISFKKLERKKSAFYLLKLKKIQAPNSGNNFITDKDYIKVEDIKKQKLLTDLRINVLEKLKHMSLDNIDIQTIQKIKVDSFLFNLVYKLNLEDLINEYHMLLSLDKIDAQKNIMNLVRVNLIKKEQSKPEIESHDKFSNKKQPNIMESFQLQNELFTNSEVKILKGESETAIFSPQLKKLFDNLLLIKNIDYITFALESVFSLYKHIDIPGKIIEEAVKLNCKRIIELMIKYRRDKDLLSIIEYSEKNDLLIDKYLFKIANKIDTTQNRQLKKILNHFSDCSNQIFSK